MSPADISSHAEAVGRFYDQHSDAFQRVYGDVIQAFRTTDVAKLLDYEACAMELRPGMKILDAGCGVCGPAIHFAARYGVEVDALTISEVQREIGARKVVEAGLGDQVRVVCGDYHAMDELFVRGAYDVVCFLESFGHSRDKARALSSAWEVLKPGGRLYIKDLFVKEAVRPELRAAIDANIRRIDDAYHYQVGDLYDVLAQVRRRGFILSALETVDIALEDFENLTISNDFQVLTGINVIEDLQTYIFPVDFFEVICIKPWYEPNVGLNRYFLQNLHHLQILGISPEDL